MDLVHFVDEQKEGIVANSEVRFTDNYFPAGSPMLGPSQPPHLLSASWDVEGVPELDLAHTWRESSVDASVEAPVNRGLPLCDRDLVGANVSADQRIEVASKLHLGCFMLCGMGATCAYTAILSSLVWYKALFGPSIFLLLNIVVYAPALPMMMLQNSFDERFNAIHGVRVAYRFRISFSFVCLVGILCLFASECPPNASFMVGITLVVGVFAGIIYGAFYQIIALMPDPRCNAYFAMGYQGVALLVLVIGISSGFNATAADGRAIQMNAVSGFFGGCAFLQLMCLLAFFEIDRSSNMYDHALDQKDKALLSVREAQNAEASRLKRGARRAARAGSPTTVPLLAVDHTEVGIINGNRTDSGTSLTRIEIFSAIWPCAAACSLTICGSIMLLPFYVCVKHLAPILLFWPSLTNPY